ncbi:hypothetical protein [Paenibacillus puerhi]|uniref:hypothetical protein n=1 Tax=Paenibacillus puerhi TaxID=2692622 RepID=UPI00135A3AFE|nr:hypothetical protein [Paenibacillus puerhi]
MQYVIQASEKTKAKGSEFETKALLYLMNFRDDSNEIYYFVIDFFNDLTAIDRFSQKSWDLQSKAAKVNHQANIGKELVTLFKNYLSGFNFDHYILFMGGIADSIRIDNTKNIFDVNNIESKSQNKIIKALVKESHSKVYIDNSKVNEQVATDFLNTVVFVIDDKSKSDYIRDIVKVNPRIIPNDIVLEHIFDQIRDAQSTKKNNNNVEGTIISAMDEFIYYNRHLTANEIKMMVLNRIINNNIMQRGITHSFIPIYSKMPAAIQKDVLEDCQHDIAKTLFDKNNAENFWDLFNNIYQVITIDKNLSIEEAYRKLDHTLLSKLNFLNIMSVKYFMAVLKDGIYED